MCLRIFLAISSIVALVAAQAATGQYTCPQYTAPNGDLFSLNGLANGGEGYSTPVVNGYFYRIAVCEVLNGRYKVNYCNANNTAVCKIPSNNVPVGTEPVGIQIAAGNPTPISPSFSPLPSNNPSTTEGVVWTMTQPSGGCPGSVINTVVNFVCDHTFWEFRSGFTYNDIAADYPKFTFVSVDQAGCNYVFNAVTHHACKRNHCPFFQNAYGTIKLDGIKSTGIVPANNPNYTITACGSLLPVVSGTPPQTWCTEPGSMACERWSGPINAMNWKTIGLSQQVTINPTDTSNSPKGVVLTATGGTYSWNCQNFHQTQLTILCDKTATTPAVTFTGKSETTCITSFTMMSNAACIVPTNGPGLIIGGHYISGGSVFLILFFISLFLYVVLGCVYNYVKNKKRGLEMFPNREFWASIPGLVMDGLRFCTCRGKKTTTAYDAM